MEIIEKTNFVVELDNGVDHDLTPYIYYIVWVHNGYVDPSHYGYVQTWDDQVVSHGE